MCKKYFFVLCALFCLLAANLPAEPWFRISGMELTRLETISQTWQQDKQTWLSQVSVLKTIAQDLQAESTSLNSQLSQERTKTQSLRKSFEQSETDRLTQASNYETEIADLKAGKARVEIEVLRVKNQRNVLFSILTLIGILVTVIIIARIRGLIKL